MEEIVINKDPVYLIREAEYPYYWIGVSDTGVQYLTSRRDRAATFTGCHAVVLMDWLKRVFPTTFFRLVVRPPTRWVP